MTRFDIDGNTVGFSPAGWTTFPDLERATVVNQAPNTQSTSISGSFARTFDVGSADDTSVALRFAPGESIPAVSRSWCWYEVAQGVFPTSRGLTRREAEMYASVRATFFGDGDDR